jgi:hypothetical protein
MSGYFENMQINGQVPSSVVEGVINSGSSMGYAFKLEPSSQC